MKCENIISGIYPKKIKQQQQLINFRTMEWEVKIRLKKCTKIKL